MKMSRISALLDKGDDALRAWLLGACRCGWLLQGLTLTVFFAVMMTRTLMQTNGMPVFYRAATVLMLCVPLAAMLHFALQAVCSCLCALCAGDASSYQLY